VATVTIKGKASSSKSLFRNLPKYTCLMAKKSKKKVKSKAPPLPNMSLVIKILFPMISIILVMMITLFLVNLWDELLEKQEELLVQERKISEELKKLLALEKCKVEKLDQELAKSKKTTCSLKSSIGAFQGQHDILLKTHQDLEVQFDALWSSTSKTSTNNEPPQVK
jgi:hypothetical protein